MIQKNTKNEKINNRVLSILRHVETRWSSFHTALDRIIELSEPLKTFMDSEYSNGDPERNYLSSKNMLMLRLLLCLTGMVNDYIKDFQKDNMSITE